MNNQSSKSLFLRLKEGQLFFFQFFLFLLKLDFKNFSCGVACQLSAKVFEFIAMFLPLKILLFLSPSQKLIEMTPKIFEGKNQFIIFLCVLALFFTALPFLFSKLSTKIVIKNLNKIISVTTVRIDKKNIENTKIKIRLCISNCTSLLLLAVLSVPLYFVYSELLFIGLVALSLSLTFLFLIHIYPLSILKKFNEVPKKTFNIISQFIFLFSFGFIIFDALTHTGSRILIQMVIGLILTRRMSNIISQLGSAIIQLNNNKEFALELMRTNQWKDSFQKMEESVTDFYQK